jgi:hypothetical protein
LNNRWISTAEPSQNQVSTLLAIADRDIQQSQTPGLGSEWRFDIAYNAALQAATAALAAAGFQAERQNKHMRTIECLAFTIGIPQSDIDVLDACRRKRHKAVYDQVGSISDQEASEMLAMAQRVRRLVEEWIRKVHPDLLA